ncbi:MAG: SUMF1/EgtB/PvdO family nonheme iron enzyme [Planctomycetes bacterium]|nr:SUMF1/EgtB/PvdO family nonheme iron enzyme [Planctomycetota bacterium]
MVSTRSSRGTLAALALAAVLTPGCPRSASSAAAIEELERMAFVPPGEAVLLARTGTALVCGNAEPLLVQRFEVTRREFRAWALERASSPELASVVETWTEDTLDWPASSMTLDEARAYAADRGLRLPTVREWLRIASGTRAQPWPWGQNEISSVANTLALRFDRPTPVGTFEQGRTPFGTYDMLGNVWEWVLEPVDPPLDPALAWSLGGSFASRQRRLYETGPDGHLALNVQELDAASRSTDLGVRCVAEAEAWLRLRADELESVSGARERLVRLGARWGSEVAPALERIARGDGAPECVRWLLEGARQ